VFPQWKKAIIVGCLPEFNAKNAAVTMAVYIWITVVNSQLSFIIV